MANNNPPPLDIPRIAHRGDYFGQLVNGNPRDNANGAITAIETDIARKEGVSVAAVQQQLANSGFAGAGNVRYDRNVLIPTLQRMDQVATVSPSASGLPKPNIG